MGTLYDMSTTDASNTAFAGISQAENVMKPSDVNNSLRAHDGALARWLADEGAVNTVAGTGDVIAVTLSQPFTGYYVSGSTTALIQSGALIRFIASAANTTNVTINVNTIGAKAIRKTSGGTDVALVAGDLAAGETYTMIYRSTANAAAGAWVLIGAAAIAAATTSTSGIVELATVAEALTGTDAVRAVTPAGLYYPTGHLFGLTLSNNVSDATNDIDITAGDARDSTDTANIALASAITKRLDAAWAVGTNQGGLDTGSIANTTYHIYVIKRVDTNVVDVIFSASASAPTLPTNYTLYRRIGSIIRASGAILGFKQDGDTFQLTTGVLETTSGASVGKTTLTCGGIPLGIRVYGEFQILTVSSGTTTIVLYDGTTGNAAKTSFLIAPTGVQKQNQNLSQFTDTSARIQYAVTDAGSNAGKTITTIGWVDTRGRPS